MSSFKCTRKPLVKKDIVEKVFIENINKMLEKDALTVIKSSWQFNRKVKESAKYQNNLNKVIENLKGNIKIKDNTDIIKNIKLTTEQIFTRISKKPYPNGDSRSNHGCYNHIRSLAMALDIYMVNRNKIKFPQQFTLEDDFCIIMATIFVSIGRTHEGNVGFYRLNDELLQSFYPNKYVDLKKYTGYSHYLHQFVSALMYQTIMKHLLPNKHDIIEECAFFIQWSYYNNTRDTLSTKHKFLYYYINTPHYIDHFRMALKDYTNMCSTVPYTFFESFIDERVKLELKKQIYLKEIIDIIETEYPKLEISYKIVTDIHKSENRRIITVKRNNKIIYDDLEREINDILVITKPKDCGILCNKLRYAIFNRDRIRHNDYNFNDVWKKIVLPVIPKSNIKVGRIKRKTNKKIKRKGKLKENKGKII